MGRKASGELDACVHKGKTTEVDVFVMAFRVYFKVAVSNTM